MKFRNSLIISLAIFLLMLLLMVAANFDSHSWPEPTTDVEYRLRGLLIPAGWVIAIAASLMTFVFLMLIGWLKIAVIGICNYFSRSDM